MTGSAIILSHGQPSDPDPAEAVLARLATDVARDTARIATALVGLMPLACRTFGLGPIGCAWGMAALITQALEMARISA